VVANEGHKIDIPDGTILENSELLAKLVVRIVLTNCSIGLLSGNLSLIVSLLRLISHLYAGAHPILLNRNSKWAVGFVRLDFPLSIYLPLFLFLFGPSFLCYNPESCFTLQFYLGYISDTLFFKGGPLVV
jgi:hypothetical protein